MTALVAAGLAAACMTTHANGSTPPGQLASPSQHGRDGLWTAFNQDGVLRINPKPPAGPGETYGHVYADGSLQTKFPWFGSRRAGKKLTLRAKRLDGTARGYVRHYRSNGQATRAPRFWATYIRFSTPGCWRVTGQAGSARLSFVIQVEIAPGTRA